MLFLRLQIVNTIYSCVNKTIFHISASTNALYLDEVDDGIWLFDVLNTIGVNDEYRQASQQQGIIGEILENCPCYATWYNMGSTIEGTATPGTTYIRKIYGNLVFK